MAYLAHRSAWRLALAFSVLAALTVSGVVVLPGTAVGVPVDRAPTTSAHDVRVGPPPIISPPRDPTIESNDPSEAIDPTAGYSSEPAPMGIADFGVGSGSKAYTYGTTEFLANLSWSSLDLSLDGDAYFTDQLNVVLEFDQGGVSFAYWIQDVAILNSSTGLLEFENNIWNFSSPSHCLSNSAVSGNGTVYAYGGGCEGYYAVGASVQPGAFEFMPSPGRFSLLVRSYTSSSNTPEVAFEYDDGAASYEVTYDNVVWPWARSVTDDNNFFVDGNSTAPSGNFYDAEFVIGGPGGGSETEAAAVTDLHSQLSYWNGHNFEAPRSTWNFGGDTAERVFNAQSFLSPAVGGIPGTTLLNGTARNATPALAYGPSQVGVISIDAAGATPGTVSVDGTDSAYVGGWANLTLVPGTYEVWVNSSGSHHFLGSCSVVGGTTDRVTLPTGCYPAVATPTATPSSVDLGQTVAFDTTLLSSGSGGDAFDWSALSSALGCSPSTEDTVVCTPTTVGTYPVQVSVTDSDGQSNSSGVLEFRVDSDPQVGTPSGSPPTAESGHPVAFQVVVSGGSGGYSYAWSGLPTPCTNTTTATATCAPSAEGTYSVAVEVTDSNHDSETSSPLAYTVAPGPSIAAPVATPAGPIELGGSVNFTTAATGGVPPYTFQWGDLPTGCSSLNATAIECLPSGSGEFNVTATVTDSEGGAATSSPAEFVVQPTLGVRPLVAHPSTTDVAETVTVASGGAVGGVGGYNYSWSGLPPGCVSENSPSIECVPQSVGNYTIGLGVTDADRITAETELNLRVDPSLVASALEASRATGDVGQAVNLSIVGVAGGSGVYSFLWSGLPFGCTAENASIVHCVPARSGDLHVVVEVQDTNLAIVTESRNYTVAPLPSVGEPTIAGASPQVGQTETYSVLASTGSGGLRYVWQGLPSGCVSQNSSTVACVPDTAGSYSVTVTVTDSNGGSATSAPPLVVNVSGSGPSPFSGEFELAAILVGGLVTIAIAAVLAVVTGRRSRHRPGPP